MYRKMIILDGHGYSVSFKVKPTPSERGRFGFPCQNLCNLKLRRPHFSCAHCPVRRVHLGKMDAKQPVHLFILPIYQHRKFRCIKEFILKRLLSICEALAR